MKGKSMNDQKKLSVDAELDGPVTILVVRGRLDGSTVALLDRAVQNQFAAGQKALVFDFHDLSYISSAGLRTILMAARQLEKAGGKSAFCALSASVADIFKMSGFSEILDVRATRAAALGALHTRHRKEAT